MPSIAGHALDLAIDFKGRNNILQWELSVFKHKTSLY
jgi:hypothetical protein